MRIVLKHAVAKQRMKTRQSFRRIERRCARRDAVSRERFLGRLRDRTLRQGMWQRLEVRIVFER
jgi:hypothetical protein